MEENKFTNGIKDGLPVCLGYFGVSFAFGIFAAANGISIWQAVLISMMNLTSAGQFASIPVIASGGTLLELGLGQFVINLRYLFMSVSLSQKFGKSVGLKDRFLIAFANTDEIFAIATSKKKDVGNKYMYGLALTPFLGWITGTFLGAAMGNILPQMVVSALGIAIYAMFVAIVVPQTKGNRKILGCIIVAMALSTMFYYIPFLKKVPSGFTVIICSVSASTLFALFAPIEAKEADNDEV